MRFPPATVALLHRTLEVLIETRSASGAAHRVPIWLVTADGQVFVRTVRGPTSRWYRELLARGGALVAGRSRVPVRAQRVRGTATVALVSASFRRKYRGSGSVAAMVRDEVLGTTLRLLPR